MPAATTASLPSIFKISRRLMRSELSVSEPGHLDDEPDDVDERDGRQDQRHPQVRLLLFFGRHEAQCAAEAPTMRVAAALSFGGVSNVWKGAGDGTSHSRPSAPAPSGSFQGRCGAFSPLPRITGSTTKKKKYTCDRPNQNAPIDATMLKSANCAG